MFQIYKEISKYVRMNLTDREIRDRKLTRLVPFRKYRRGRFPGMSGDEATKKNITEEESKFVYPNVDPTEEEKINLFATALEIAVKFMFTHHVYTFGSERFKQSDSSPTGLRLSMAVSRIVTGQWGEKLRSLLDTNSIKRFLDGLFVDDGRLVISSLEPGQRWDDSKKKIIFKEEWKEEDEESGESSTKRTSREILKMMNSIYSLQWTVEIEEEFPDKRIPSLDFSLFMEEEEEDGQKKEEKTEEEKEERNISQKKRKKINFGFFQKKMKNPFCIMKNSAMSEKSKIIILAQDLIRRMSHINEKISQEERDSVVNDYIDRLVRSGYTEEQVRQIIQSGLTGYVRKLQRAKKTGTPFHKPAKMTLKTRMKKRLTQRESWYKNTKRNEDEVEERKNKKKMKIKRESGSAPIVSLMFVPYSQHSELIGRLKKAEATVSAVTGDKVVLAERAGKKLRDLLHKADPFGGQKCKNSDQCLICSCEQNKPPYLCEVRNVCYRSFCRICFQKTEAEVRAEYDADKEAVDDKKVKQKVESKMKYYIGETHRSAGRDRGPEHLADKLSKSESSHQWKHISTDHGGLEPEDVEFGMQVIRRCRSSLEREIFENVSIFLLGDRALNSRAQQSYNRCVVPRLSVMHGDSGAPPVYDKAELELLVTDQKESLLERQSKRKEVKQGPPSKKRKLTNNIVSRFSYKERKVEEKPSKSEAIDSKVTVFNNADGRIVPSSEVITRNSFKGRPKDKETKPTNNAKVAINSNKKQTKISSFMKHNN